jgi:hypothetical protein
MSEKNLTIIATKGTLDWAYPPLYPVFNCGRVGLQRDDVLHLLRFAIAEKRSESFSESAW